jgi:hypothetical protein
MARRSNDRQSVTSFCLVCSASLFQFLLAADSGSIYDPPPSLSYSWDPDQSAPAHRTSNSVHPSKSSGDYQNDSESQRYQSSSLNHLHSVASYELGPHPADPHSTVLLTSTSFTSSPQISLASGASGNGATNGSVKGNGSWDEHRFGPGTCTERVSGQELWVYGGQGGFVITLFQPT